jgi:geranylgeranyl diphosphate synthase type I
LLAAAYEGVSPDADASVAFDAGVCLELLQSYLLIQDDWIDGDATRRGGPSVHALLASEVGDGPLGHAFAILASDLGWGLALETLAPRRRAPARIAEAVRLLVRVHEDVVHGQVLDVLGEPTDVERMHDLKTGSYTVRGPLLLGATLAGAEPAVLSALTVFAAPLGVAFQLRDDLLGTFGHEAQTGKRRGGDLLAGKRSAVYVEAETQLDSAGKAAVSAIFGRRDAGEAELEQAIAAVSRSGARQRVEARLEDPVRASPRARRTAPPRGVVEARARGGGAGISRSLDGAA